MNAWERFDEVSFPKKEDLYSSQNMEEITGVDYMHEKKVIKIFDNKNISDYHDLFV